MAVADKGSGRSVKTDGRKPDPVARANAAMSAGKIAYETRRAAEAGLSLDAWLKRKAREAAPAASAPVRKAPARKGLIARLLDKAHRPL